MKKWYLLKIILLLDIILVLEIPIIITASIKILFIFLGATCEEWSTREIKGEKRNRLQACSGAAFFSDAYAIGKLTVDNGGWGDLHWELISSIDGSLLDSIAIQA